MVRAPSQQSLTPGLWPQWLMRCWVVCLGLFISLPLHAIDGQIEVAAPHVNVSLLSESSHIVPGQTLQLALRLRHEQGWHSYWKNPGDTGLPTRLIWQLPEGFQAGDLEWPVPERIDFDGAINFGYHGDTWLLTTVSVPQDLTGMSTGGEFTLNALAKWLICKDICIPGEAALALTLPIADSAADTANQKPLAHVFEQARRKIPTLIYDVPASYSLADNFVATIDIKSLPVFQRKPSVFLGVKGVVGNSDLPAIAINDDSLLVTASIDPYFDQPPQFLPLVLVTGPSTNDDPLAAGQAIELVARFHEAASGFVSDRSPVPPSGTPASGIPAHAELTASGGGSAVSLSSALILALIGGLILNAMPCVFPVLSLKIVSLVESGNHSLAERYRHGIAYTLGVVLSFLLVAAVLIALRSAGEQVGWGFQLQSPWFIAFLVYLLFVLGLSLSGFIELGSSLQNIGSGLRFGNGDSSRWQGSFFTGVLATVVATPCTAPFMGSAMGFALSQPAAIALLVFGVMGFGLALPFLLIAFIPGLANALPKPGNWMVQLKEFLAFPIYLTVVWLIWVFSRQAGADAVAVLLVGLVLLVFSLWLWRAAMFRDGAVFAKATAAFSLLLAVSMIVVSLSVQRPMGDNNIVESGAGVGAQSYSPERLAHALENGESVLVNMTADWCITCKVNERVALNTEEVQSVLAERAILYLKGDWTNSDPAITDYLSRFNRNGVPLYVVYKPGVDPKILPQILTPGIVLDSLR